ncbi:replicative DNA helicase [Orientia tsutsugamushi]|uniref:Replicative DNA helicase n=1 Tax=Orientia tsutsugamushi TaxID=784 RepID=A0A2U3RAM9_ORITS|nr:hypothetical protein OTSUT76_2360 [Orientia tsutsugamushi str. UT76]SPR10198.1 replicative DNA helicase [Orientia tsutsugamushi]
MPEIKLNLRPNLLCLFRCLSAIILNYLNQFRKRSNCTLSLVDLLHYAFHAFPYSNLALLIESRSLIYCNNKAVRPVIFHFTMYNFLSELSYT